MLSHLVAILAPPRCALCRAACGTCAQLCGRCDSSLDRLPGCSAPVKGLGPVWSAAPYEGVARDLVAALKFGARLSLAERAAAAIAARAPSQLLDGTIVPVPPAPWRRRWRGFDPADAIARALAAQTRLSLGPCLRRTQGRRQVGRPRSERLAEPPEVRVAALPPGHAILLDDVVTTGATLGACAAALRGAGAERVVGLTFARSGG